MTVKELIDELSKLNPDLPVIMSKDTEGNGFSPLHDAEEAFYLSYNTWSGEHYSEEDEDDEFDTPEGTIPAVFLWPVN